MISLLLATALSLPVGDTVRVPLTSGDTIDVQVSGNGAPVVIVPGLLGGTYSFRKVVDGLVSRGFRVYAIDLLNPESMAAAPAHSLHAQSERLTAVLDSLDVARAILITHTLGGGVVYRTALQRPDLARAIVAIEAGPAETANSPAVRNALKYSLLIRIIGARRTLEKQVRDGLKKSAADPSWVTDELVRSYTEPFAGDFNRTLRAFKGMSESTEPAPLAPRLPELRLPVVFLTAGGPREGTMPQDQMASLKTIPTFETQTVERSGTWIQEERPDHIVELVQALATAQVRSM